MSPCLQTVPATEKSVCDEEGEADSSTESEDMPVNGLPDVDHISFSYSSDDDFLPHHMKQSVTGGDLKLPKGGEKPSRDSKSHQKSYHGNLHQDDVQGKGKVCKVMPDSRPELTGEQPLDTRLGHTREKRKCDPLSLAQRRRRLCSVVRKTPLATPTATVATPTSNLTTSTSLTELSRQPISPGILSSSPKYVHSSRELGSREMEATFHSTKHTQHSRHKSPDTVQPLPDGRRPRATLSGDWSSVSEASSDSDSWEPESQGKKKERKKQKNGPGQNTCREQQREGRKRKKQEREGRVKKKKNSKRNPLPPDRPVSCDDSDDSDEGLSKVRAMVTTRLKERPSEPNGEKVHSQAKELSDDEKVLEELKRKVWEDGMAEQLMSQDGSTPAPTASAAEAVSLEDELAMSTSSSDEEAISSERLKLVEGRRQMVAKSDMEEEVTNLGGKARSKRQMLLSSDSESDGTDSRIPDREHQQSPGRVRAPHNGRTVVKQEKPGETKSSRSPVREDPRKRETDSTTSSPVKKLRLIDIDFTGGRMRQSTFPLPPKSARHNTNSGKPRTQTSRYGLGSGQDRKLKAVPANASNILKLSKPVKPVSHSLHSSKPSQLLSKKPAQDRRDPLTHKDAVLAAKFPQKRKLFDCSTPNRAHLTTKPKPSHKYS